jgi:UDP-N-acetylmuramoyl-L-alanyl-D-glutamate--2,6-diaminopimelate ligase
MRLRDLLGGDGPSPGIEVLDVVQPPAGSGSDVGSAAADAVDPEITGVTHDTRQIRAGTLFCCVRGERVDGHDLAGAAVEAGAAALLVDRRLDPATIAVPQVLVPEVRRTMGPVAARFWGDPSRRLTVVGVTGTAGKTTMTHLLRSIFEAAGRSCGIIGTLSGARTTPEGTELQATLAAERDAGRRAVAMEVSSHGLDMHRVDGTRFAAAVFTNLSRDHLDYHHTMDAYFAAKARLFSPELADRAVVCTDDEWGRKLVAQLSAGSSPGAGGGFETRTYGIDDAEDLDMGPSGARFTWHGEPIEVAMPGRFNVLNALGAATAALSLGLDAATIAEGLRTAGLVPGRFEPVDGGQPFTVLVDYSHKPDALEQALLSARELAPKGRLIVVFGCGGDRDAGKRPSMGEVAARLADHVVLTSDNPRSEDPLAIIDEIRAGIPAALATGPDSKVEVEADRRRAISAALAQAGPGDLVLVAGKGHETTQTVGESVVDFDDRAVARQALGAAGFGAAS